MLVDHGRIDEIDYFLGVLAKVLLLGFPLAPLSGTVIDFTMGFFVKSDMVSCKCLPVRRFNGFPAVRRAVRRAVHEELGRVVKKTF